MKHLKVRVTLEVELDWPDEWRDPFFTLEDNGCPGTGSVGSIIEEAIRDERNELNTVGSSYCWACQFKGENKIIEVDGAPVE